MFILRKIGEAKTKELLLSGELISSDKAAQYGLINFIESKETIADKVMEYAINVCENASGDSLRYTKKLIADIQNIGYSEALDYASKINAKARETTDCKKGIAAFLNKEKISWR
jgi:methylglutaconyl-CoA hydratase